MEFLWKETLKRLCGSNQWSYAVFWKIGCQNPRLLIWEDHHYEPSPRSTRHCMAAVGTSSLAEGWVSAGSHSTQLGDHEVDRVAKLINEMMMNNQVNFVGEGMVGRAAFTGKHQWIVLNDCSRDAHPPEFLTTVHHQIAAGMQTLAVIPVLPHGVVQFGSSHEIMENFRFVNDVKRLILQLGCTPKALLSENYTTKVTGENMGVPVTHGVPLHANSQGTSTVANFSSAANGMVNLQNEFSHISLPPGQLSDYLLKIVNNPSIVTGINGSSALQSGRTPKIKSESDAVPLSDMQGQSHANSLYPEGSIFENLCAQNGLVPRKTVADSLRTLNMPSFLSEECISAIEHPGFLQDGQCNDMMNGDSVNMLAKQESCAQPLSGNDLFDVLGVDLKHKLLSENWNDLVSTDTHFNANTSGKNNPTFGDMQEIGLDCFSVNEAISDGGVFSETGSDNLLNAVVSKAQTSLKRISDDNLSCKTMLTRSSSSSLPSSSLTNRQVNMNDDFLQALARSAQTNSLNSVCSKDDRGISSQTTSLDGSQLSSWVERGSNLKGENSVSTAYSQRPDEVSKSNHKRLKLVENPRPRPKDRQMFQDRMKELREIVPNGAKCSKDELLGRTISHMLFLQSVTKHADRLKQTGESKFIGKDGGLLLRDNFEGGATWAYEVGSQSMVCPIIVEDLNQPRQMLVEMFCDERGFFLEIADFIRGLGLTILKGVMEVKNDKIWARFAVEANRDVTRMEIFMSLVRLLE